MGHSKSHSRLASHGCLQIPSECFNAIIACKCRVKILIRGLRHYYCQKALEGSYEVWRPACLYVEQVQRFAHNVRLIEKCLCR